MVFTFAYTEISLNQINMKDESDKVTIYIPTLKKTYKSTPLHKITIETTTMWKIPLPLKYS